MTLCVTFWPCASAGFIQPHQSGKLTGAVIHSMKLSVCLYKLKVQVAAAAVDVFAFSRFIHLTLVHLYSCTCLVLQFPVEITNGLLSLAHAFSVSRDKSCDVYVHTATVLKYFPLLHLSLAMIVPGNEVRRPVNHHHRHCNCVSVCVCINAFILCTSLQTFGTFFPPHLLGVHDESFVII